MEIFVEERGFGKTAKLLKWLKNSPAGQSRAIVCHESRCARVLLSQNPDIKDWQIVSVDQLDKLQGINNLTVAIDNLELVLPRLFGFNVNVQVVTATV